MHNAPAVNSPPTDLLDYTAVRRHLETYMSAVDRRDFETVADCFTADAEIRMHVLPGKPDSGELHRGGTAFAKALRRLEKFKATNHSLANVQITIEGAKATADCRVSAWLMGEVEGHDRVIVRSIHVVEELTRSDGAWKISKRLHTPMIQFEVPASPAVMPHRR